MVSNDAAATTLAYPDFELQSLTAETLHEDQRYEARICCL